MGVGVGEKASFLTPIRTGNLNMDFTALAAVLLVNGEVTFHLALFLYDRFWILLPPPALCLGGLALDFLRADLNKIPFSVRPWPPPLLLLRGRP